MHRILLRRVAEKNCAGLRVLHQHPLGRKVIVQPVVALQVVLGKVGPKRGIGPEVAHRLRLKGAHFADGSGACRLQIQIQHQPA